MIEIKVYDEMEIGKGKQVEMHLEGPKLGIMAEFTLAIRRFIKDHLNEHERFAFLMTIIDIT